MRKIAIIGASHFQNPLILKAKEKGLETHVFAWRCGDVGESTADYFYPISITDRDQILKECQRIGVAGVASIGSDLANITVAYVASEMGLVANSVGCVKRSTDKGEMRRSFHLGGDPSPLSVEVADSEDPILKGLLLPLIVKPNDRSGSRGITLVEEWRDLQPAIDRALKEGFSGKVVVEEYVDGPEYSVECLSWEGEHEMLAITEKFTTGAPGFVEKAHLEPARIGEEIADKVKKVVFHALDTLGVEYGASHSEVKISQDGVVTLIEIGSRMGGDCIGSDLVRLSTGYDYVEAVIDVALGVPPKPFVGDFERCSAVRFIFDESDIRALGTLKRDVDIQLVYESGISEADHAVTDSSNRLGYYIFTAKGSAEIVPYLPS